MGHDWIFGGNPDLDPDAGILKEFYHYGKNTSSWVLHRCENTQAIADHRLNELKAVLVEVCALPSASILVSIFYLLSNNVMKRIQGTHQIHRA